MEEKEKLTSVSGEANNEPISYDELKKNYDVLFSQYQRMSAEYGKCINELRQRDFDYMSFFLQMLFKVIEHKGAYKPEFGKWATENIQNLLLGFAESLNSGKKEKPNEEKKDEA